MPKVLTAAQVERFEHDNFLAPIGVLTAQEVHRFRRCPEADEAEQRGAPLDAAPYRRYRQGHEGQIAWHLQARAS